MTSTTFFPTRWPSSTFGPGLHNYEIHGEQSSCARGWNASRAALHLQTLYSHLRPYRATEQSYFCYDGNIYSLWRGFPLPCFLNSIEAKCKDISVLKIRFEKVRSVSMAVVIGHCAEKLVPTSHHWELSSQFPWAFRWMFTKCNRQKAEEINYCLSGELD